MSFSGPNGEWWSMRVHWDAGNIDRSFSSWRIWYADGSEFHSSAGAWSDAPSAGVQVLMLYYPDAKRRAYNSAFDEYCLPGEPTTKLGLMIDWETFIEIDNRAKADPRFE